MKIIGNKDGVRSPEFHRKKERERKIKKAILVFFVVIFLALPIFLVRMARFRIASISIEGDRVSSAEDIKKVVNRDIAGSYLWLIPKSNALFYPEEKIESDLLNEIPKLSAATVELDGMQTVVVTASEREPFALYCKSITSETASKCFFLDSAGYVFSEAPSFSEGIYTVYGSEEPVDNPLGQVFIEAKEFQAIHAFGKMFDEAHIPIRALIIGDDITVLLPDGGKVLVKRNENFDKVFSNFVSLVDSDTFNEEPNAWKRLLYIDLRLGNKIHYKFKD